MRSEFGVITLKYLNYLGFLLENISLKQNAIEANGKRSPLQRLAPREAFICVNVQTYI